MKYLVILDDGHGNDTSGKRTPFLEDGTFMKENEFNKEVVMLIFNKLKNLPDIDVAFTAPENYDVPLDTRIRRANQFWKDHQNYFGEENSKCVLISVHANAYGSGGIFNSGKGVETYCCSNPPEERIFAETIHKHLKGGTTQIDRGVKETCFAILKVNMTSCLVECAFMTNETEAKLLLQESFRNECAEEITAGILEYFNLKRIVNDVKYTSTVNGTHQISGSAENLKVKFANQKNNTITDPNCVNGTFFWWEDAAKTKLYPTSILIIDGKIYRNEANHYYDFGSPQSVFIIYKDDKVDMKRVKFATELDYKNIKIAVGGLGLANKEDSSFRFNPNIEGFKKGNRLQDGKEADYSDVLAKRNKTVIGYNKSEDKIYLMCRKNISHAGDGYNLLNLVRDCEYDIALSLDGGGSTFMNNEDSTVVYGDGRRINNIIGFNI